VAQKLTPWFPGSVKPTRKGVYERKATHEQWFVYSRWDGKHWHLNSLSLKAANQAVRHSSYQCALLWRGVAAKPKA
jgi:hypothetical protein